jgi:hypothetical protein
MSGQHMLQTRVDDAIRWGHSFKVTLEPIARNSITIDLSEDVQRDSDGEERSLDTQGRLMLRRVVLRAVYISPNTCSDDIPS